MQEGFTRKGFTLIELSLSILFISVLSLAVALLIVNAITAYRRGITLNQVNDMGMELTDDIRTAVQSAQAKSAEAECSDFYEGDKENIEECKKDSASKFSSLIVKGKVKSVDGNSEFDDVPIFGAFCSGSYSYIWNSGYFFSDEYSVDGDKWASLKYKDQKGKAQEIGKDSRIKLLKIKDKERNVCKTAEEDYGNDQFDGRFDISSYNNIDEDPVDIMADSTLLAIYDLSATVVKESLVLNNSLYSVSFILGTERGGINIRVSGNSCATPEDYNQLFDYCAINKFNFVAQANGG